MEHTATVVPLRGEYDSSRRDELDQLLDRYGDADRLVFDLRDVTRFDTSALRSLIRFQRARKEAGKSPIVFAQPTSPVRDFFRAAQLDRTFDIQNEL